VYFKGALILLFSVLLFDFFGIVQMFINVIFKCSNIFTAHSAMDFEEFAEGLKRAYSDLKFVELLNKFTNFSDTVQPLLNTANTTEGADHFNEFRFKK
jgi:hypothetical protein